jgi:uncharacterized membrane protein YhdT
MISYLLRPGLILDAVLSLINDLPLGYTLSIFYKLALQGVKSLVFISTIILCCFYWPMEFLLICILVAKWVFEHILLNSIAVLDLI